MLPRIRVHWRYSREAELAEMEALPKSPYRVRCRTASNSVMIVAMGFVCGW